MDAPSTRTPGANDVDSHVLSVDTEPRAVASETGVSFRTE
jgi:hypothetical protein